MTRKTPRRNSSTSRGYYDESPSREKSSFFNLNRTYLAILGGVLILGIGIGIAFSSTANFNTENVASRVVIDRSAPNPEFCAQYGASAIVTDMRVFMTLNPFSVYVTQPSMVPGCVMRSTNWSILEDKNLLSHQEVQQCKRRMNTFGFTGSLENSPNISCIYQNDSAGNLFRQNGSNNLTPVPEKDNF
ncbi:DUF3172 domain-containing protein [Euhalothece natronophila Z-M001]|uniref:DUF3172 domain-containing protein n=1 Tax=Euhalothece natronophila Z-M001 TaxID=522448 RepID=A0A5B8NM59_9CHRO|nr:DUF3172 domain-containing protein [Euhalothece natronophila]QDZ39169.1 DUF3172 domain-containing protein [Euhalothece natronophila Z-M001]